MNKLYCFVDETGQNTEGKFFLVAIVLKNIKTLSILETRLTTVEENTRKGSRKWKKINTSTKKEYLAELLQITELKSAIFYSIYKDSKEYSKLTSLTIAKAVLAKNDEDYSVTIVVDGLNDSERDVVRKELKKLRIRYRKIRGMKDEQSIFLRLSDAMAGFLRDTYREETYTKKLINRFKKDNFITET